MAKVSEGTNETTEAAGPAAAQVSAFKATTELERRLLAVVDHIPSMIFLKDQEYRYLFVNATMGRLMGHAPADLLGKTDYDTVPPATAAEIHAREAEVMATGLPAEHEEEIHTHTGVHHFQTRKFVARDADGEVLGVAGIITDITERKRVEAARFEEQQRTIAAQRDTLRELSTPLLPIADGIVAMPLVGAIDRARADELLETLLRGVTTQRARIAILDVTGIRELDGEVARALVTAARATRLVGAEVVLTGISPAVAQTLVSLGVDLGDVTTLATLASGIAFALRRR